MKIHLRKNLGDGTTSIGWVDLPEVPARGDAVVDTKGERWVVESRVWVAPTKGIDLEIILYVRL